MTSIKKDFGKWITTEFITKLETYFNTSNNRIYFTSSVLLQWY